jgi:hypothetical protein
MVNYFVLGGHKQLNEIVFAGSHDAGITGGGANVQTQTYQIGTQAYFGVRIFDLRIAAATLPDYTGLGKEAEMRTFHADKKVTTTAQKSRYVMDVGRDEEITRTKLRAGAWGVSLSKVLDDAKGFVKHMSPSEFLILKFDKCSNWHLIAEACVNLLGDTIYTDGGNVNIKSLSDLRGKVIVAFTPKGYEAAQQKGYGPDKGIVCIKNLAEGGAYDPNFVGLQYYGKGGTSPFNPFSKIKQNIKKQSKLMKKGSSTDVNVMGMMYWTTTGLSGSIRERNDSMWTSEQKRALKELWNKGLYESISERIASHVTGKYTHQGPILKAFMPNMVMIDFADANKCSTIYALNSASNADLTLAASVLDPDA